MKIRLFALLFGLLGFLGCTYSEESLLTQEQNVNELDVSTSALETRATITGINYGNCICCAGWFIDIEGVTDAKWFLELPEGSGIDLNTASFPIEVRIDWSDSETTCPNVVTIESIEIDD